MTRVPALAVLAAVSLPGCSGSGETEPPVESIVSDTQVLAEAEAAANDVIRNAFDCEAVAASLPSAMARLDEVESQVQTVVGRTTLETLRKQVGAVGEACGAR